MIDILFLTMSTTDTQSKETTMILIRLLIFCRFSLRLVYLVLELYDIPDKIYGTTYLCAVPNNSDLRSLLRSANNSDTSIR